jgi:outer membrane protein assembly factor BamB
MRPIGARIYLMSLLMLALAAVSCSPSRGTRSEGTTAPDTWRVPTPISAPQPNSNGAMVRANVHGTGVFAAEGVRQLNGIHWKFRTIEYGVKTPPVIHNSVVYFGGRDGRIYAVDAATGTEKWNRTLDTQSTSAPAIAGDTVYAGGWVEFYALSAETGAVKWIFRPAGGAEDGYYSDPIVYGGTVYVGLRHNLYAVDSHNGQEIWQRKLSGATTSVGVVYDDVIYVGTYSADDREDTYLYAIDSHNGQELWKFKTSGGGIGGAVAVADEMVYVGTTDEGLLALDAKSGEERWRFYPASGVTTAPAVANGLVYITDRGALYAVDAQTGKQKWTYQGSDGFYSDPVIASGLVYYTTSEPGPGSSLADVKMIGYLHAVDAQTGQEQWKLKVSGDASRAPAIANATVYFGSAESYLYAIR